MTSTAAPRVLELASGRRVRRPRVALMSVGLAAYWPQFPGLREALLGHAARLAAGLRERGAEVLDVGLVSSAPEAARAGEQLRAAAPDLVVVNLATYATSSQVVPALQRAAAPALLVGMQPSASMDHAGVDTGGWLEYCGVCSLPEMAAALTRCGIAVRSVSGHLDHARAWGRIEEWVRAAGVVGAMRGARLGVLGHLYPGMLDISTDFTAVQAQLGGHVEVLEMDDLRVRVDAVSDARAAEVEEIAREVFAIDDGVDADDLHWAARVAAAQQALVDDFQLDALAYYYRGLGEDQYERLAAGMILGSSLLTAAGVPCAGEYDLRTALAMLLLDRLGAGGSFTEFQALDFERGAVEMGHDGPAHLGVSQGRPVLRGLDLYHGKRGWGVSVEFSVRHGPATLLGVTQRRDGALRLVVAEGEVVDGPHMRIGNTTSRLDFGCDPGEFADAWSAAAPSHHWALGLGHQARVLRCVADLAGLELVEVCPGRPAAG